MTQKVPVDLLEIASQAEAETGTATNRLMTPERVKQSVSFNVPPPFAAGTRLSFQQTSAPKGWTKDTTAAINDAILRLVTGSVGSGGSTAFSTFNGQTAVGARTLSAAESGVPAHTHVQQVSGGSFSGGSGTGATGTIAPSSGPTVSTVANTATSASSSHDHSITTSIKYYDFIIASKN